jgi:hypothetical protein
MRCLPVVASVYQDLPDFAKSNRRGLSLPGRVKGAHNEGVCVCRMRDAQNENARGWCKRTEYRTLINGEGLGRYTGGL